MNSPTVPLAARAKSRPGASLGQAAPAARPGKQTTANARVRIRLYRHGLGDCMLLRFAGEESGETFNVLIDCGLITVADEPKDKMQKVANDIRQACNGRLDVVVMTHEHWDHVSGFHPSQARDVLASMEIGEVWYGWTEDPRNELGQRLRAERAAKLNALATAVAVFNDSPSPGVKARGTELGRMLGFFGLKPGEPLDAKAAKIGKTRDAFEYLQGKQEVKTRYLSPKQAPRALAGAPNVRVYVLGPPPDEGMIKRSAPTKKGREVYELASELQLASNLGAAFLRLGPNGAADGDSFDDCPFDPGLRRGLRAGQRHSPALVNLLARVWQTPGDDWRKIEEDWTQAAETLALNLDSHTNNTCLVLAFEFIDTGEVMLFPADAQVGNWLSWQDLRWKVGTGFVTGPELLARTVFYKVGHHGSHNATLRDKGLEQMTSEDLIAFIPVSKNEAKKNRWMGMPFNPLVERLKEKTFGRLLVADESCPGDASLAGLSPAARKRFKTCVEEQDLWFEISLR